MRDGKNIIFLLLILAMLIPSGIIVARNLKIDPISTSLSDDNVLKVLFIIEHDNVPISTNGPPLPKSRRGHPTNGAIRLRSP